MDLKYEKREGTAAISGQLYEINLISLISFRLQHDPDIEVLHLASNMARSGSFDDICFRVHMKDCEKPLLVFIQAKHKENEDHALNYDLFKHFYASYVEVKEKFYTSKDVFFQGKFEDAECVFILYTNAKYFNETPSNSAPVFKQRQKPYQSSYSEKLNQLIATGDAKLQGFQTDFSEKDLEFTNEKLLEEEISTLAEHFARFLNDKTNQSMNIMNDKYILLYHVILAKSVVNISDIKSDEKKTMQWRVMTFRQTFFYLEDHILIMLRKKIYQEIFKNQINKNNNSSGKQRATSKRNTDQSSIDEDKLISSFLSKPSAFTLSALLGTFVTYKNGNLSFIVERSKSDVKKLEQINISQSTVDKAIEIAARHILLTLQIKVPVTFGNLDLTMGGNLKKIEKRLNTLTDFLFKLCKDSTTVIIDETVGEGYLSLNNGIGSAVGNLLVYDKATQFLKFTESPLSLPKNAKSLYDKLDSKIENLDTYRFDVRVTFPKLIFHGNFNDEAKHILNKVVIYDKQSNHNGVEAILKKEIEQHQQTHESHNFLVKSDTVVTKYHKIIQKGWMSSKTGTYITKYNNIYKEAINDIVKEPQISAMQATFRINNLNYITYNFSKTAIESLASLKDNPKTIIFTFIAMLTTLKVIQFYRSICHNGYIVLDFVSMLNLPSKDFEALITELENTENLLIIVCENTKLTRSLYNRLDILATVTENKSIVVVVDDELNDNVSVLQYFRNADILCDFKQSLNHFSLETQRLIMKSSEVMFQGEKVSLDLLIGTKNNHTMCETLMKMIKGPVLNKVICKKTIKLGESLSNSNYEKIKHLYVDRRIRHIPNRRTYRVENLYDIEHNAVIIVAEAGMGKSTLLTHLSLKTKEIDKDVWIVKINLLDHTKQFKKWQDDKTVINTLEAVKFMCQIVLDNYDATICLQDNYREVYLEEYLGWKDENDYVWSRFVLGMFLHYYNKKKLIFLLDGFDEICPNYKNTVINLISVVKNRLREHKLWVTSRPYNDILVDLQEVIGISYKIRLLNNAEQSIYLENIWKDKLTPATVNNDQLTVIKAMLNADTISEYVDWHFYKEFRTLFDHLYKYTLSYFPTGFGSDSSGNIRLSIIYTPDSGTSHKVKSFMEASERVVMGTPFLLNLLGNHIVNVIYNYNSINKVELKMKRLTIYEIFIQTQMDEMRFQIKNKMDTSRPDVTTIVDKERSDCMNLHKKLAALTLLGDIFEEYDELNKNMLPFSGERTSEMDAMFDAIRSGREKTGLITHVTKNNIPVFIMFKRFAEYFASDFLCDVFKSEDFKLEDKRLLYGLLTIYAHETVYLYWIEKRMKMDEELAHIIQTMRSNIIGFCINEDLSNLLSYALLIPPYLKRSYFNNSHILKILFSSAEDYDDADFVKFINEKSKEIKKDLLNSSNTEMSIKLVYIHSFIGYYFVSKMKPHLRIYFVPSMKEMLISNVRRIINRIRLFLRLFGRIAPTVVTGLDLDPLSIILPYKGKTHIDRYEGMHLSLHLCYVHTATEIAVQGRFIKISSVS